MIRLYYWKELPNAGDYYSCWLASKVFCQGVTYEDQNPNLAVVGSILDHKHLTNDTIVWGCGWHNYKVSDFCRITNKANFKAVRGRLTAEYLGLDLKKVALGDPGLLASKFYTPKNKPIKKACLICHKLDYAKLSALYGKQIDVISMATNDITGIFELINQYEFVLSTSLHGIIFAHSFGIPALHVEYNNVGSRDNFKFKDYYSVLDIPYEKYKIDITKDIDQFSQFIKQKNKFLPSAACVTAIQVNLLNAKPTDAEINRHYRAVICAIAKNENAYIDNWVNYNLNIGFDHIYLYDNNDGKTDWVGKYITQKDKVTIINVNNVRKQFHQLICYNRFYKTRKDYFNWAAFIDIDEFIDGVSDINKFLSNTKFKNYDSIRIKWRLFGDDDMVKRDLSVPVHKAFHNAITDLKLASQGKCIVRGKLKSVSICSCHYACNGDGIIFDGNKIVKEQPTPLKACLPSGKPCISKISITEDYQSETIYLNHFMTKTLDEFLVQKFGRGDAVFEARGVDMSYYWRLNKPTLEKLEYLKSLGIDCSAKQTTKVATKTSPKPKTKAATKQKPKAGICGKPGYFLAF